MKEIWKKVRGFENYAEVSNLGQIHRFRREWYTGRNHQIKRIQEEEWTYGNPTYDGYLNACIGGVNKGVHVWVYLTFFGDIPDGLQVNHLDEDKHNNCVWNLNLMTPKDNCNWGTRNRRVADANRGRKHSPEHIAKVAAAQRGKPRPKVSAAMRGRKRPDISAAMRGRKLSEEHKAKLSVAKKGKYNTKCSKPVQALDPATMEVVMEFPSTMEAQRHGFSQGNVAACCRNCYHRPGNNIYKGFIWRWKSV